MEYDSYYNPVPLIKLPPLAERIVEPDDVYFFTDDREEKEVVIIPEEAWDYIETDAYQIECEEFTEKKSRQAMKKDADRQMQLAAEGKIVIEDLAGSDFEKMLLAVSDKETKKK